MNRTLISLFASLLFVAACSSEKKDNAGEGDTASKTASKAAKATLPTETETLALDQGKSTIPATIEAPKGSTTFNDSPTAIRVTYQEGEAFGIDVTEGNEFNVDLEDLEKGMLENKYGSTNETLEKSENLYVWKMTTDGHSSVKFQQVIDLGGKKWVCKTGNYGGYDRAQVDRMIEACKTLKAK